MPRSSPAALASALAAALLLSGCGSTAQRIAEIGQPPTFSKPDRSIAEARQPIAMPMPIPNTTEPKANSLWRPGSRAFFKDQRANEVGDILTVTVNITDQASLENRTSRSRDASEDAGIGALMGLEGAAMSSLFPEGFDPADMASVGTSSSSTGNGQLEREETINLKVAAVIMQVLPNGNLAIAGRQEVRVNHEMRELTVTGVIRPEDINSDNTVPSDKIAEARISYGGRGIISDVQQPRYGQQLFDIVFPF